ncbi:PIN domain-containing protein [Halalkalicoccus sp. NIPERK01]|uniref:PIN domain-containing protein n=1 Tax=Halalkalicoccus sp. NIPERK01 TaxID=3053469 RepID=UPI00256EEE37|nr:PIN domain-containing protein [Halalkalicoccus sp. NIPERK01]MDL5363157.1 PIN domain-containing protein [Halalkalicoccus sp. NIPERK01]
MILDSTFLIDLLDRLDAAEHTLEELIETETPVAVSPLSVYETGLGLREDEYEAFHEILASITILPLGLAESQRALGIQRTLYGQGTPIGDLDALIAATAIESPDPRVLTRNVDEFDRIEAIEVESY